LNASVLGATLLVKHSSRIVEVVAMSVENLLLAVTEPLDRLAVPLVAGLQGVLDGIDPDHPDAEDAVRAHARTCLLALLERGAPEDLRAVSLELGDVLRGLVASQSTVTAIAAEEWARIASMAAARRGSSHAERALRTRHGKGAEVLQIACRASGALSRAEILAQFDARAETTWLSHVLGELVQAGLVVRWTEGRDSWVEATGAGRRIARRRINAAESELDIVSVPALPTRGSTRVEPGLAKELETMAEIAATAISSEIPPSDRTEQRRSAVA
jgi:hypothetical protein